MMKKLLLFAALLLGCGSLKAQDLPVTASPADTLAPLNVYTVDSTLVGRSIFNLLPDQVKVHQPASCQRKRGQVRQRLPGTDLFRQQADLPHRFRSGADPLPFQLSGHSRLPEFLQFVLPGHRGRFPDQIRGAAASVQDQIRIPGRLPGARKHQLSGR